MAATSPISSPSCLYFGCLPHNLTVEILSSLSLFDLVQARCSSKALKELSKASKLWEAHEKREYSREDIIAAKERPLHPTNGVSKVLMGAEERLCRAAIDFRTVKLNSLWGILDFCHLHVIRTTQVGVRNNPLEPLQKMFLAATSPTERCYASFLMSIRTLDCQPLPADFPKHFKEQVEISKKDPLMNIFKTLNDSNINDPCKVTEVLFVLRASSEYSTSIAKKRSLFILGIKDVALKLKLPIEAVSKGMAALPIKTSRNVFHEFRLISEILTYGVKMRFKAPSEDESIGHQITKFALHGFLPTPKIYTNMLEFCDERSSDSAFKINELVRLNKILLQHKIKTPPEFQAKLEEFAKRGEEQAKVAELIKVVHEFHEQEKS